MIHAGLDQELLRELDALLRVVAPVEHPVGASPLVVTFADLELERDFMPRICGFSSVDLDRFAASIRSDESLVGRPVVAVALDRAIRFATRGGEFFGEIALESARDVCIHELAHSVARQPSSPDETIAPASFPGWIRGRLSAEPGLLSGPSSHGSDWWIRYVVLVARLATVAPKLYPENFFAAAVERYGFGKATDAAAWIAAAKADPDLLSGSVLDAASRRTPEIKRLLDTTRPRAAEPVSVAATQEA